MNKKVTATLTRKSKHRLPFRWEWLILLIVILVVMVIRIRLLDIPLERDEGEYAYAGQLILQGIAPFQEVRMPGVYAAYAFIMAVFGETPAGIHTGLLFLNMGTVILLVFVGKKLFDLMTGVVAGASFAVLSLSQFVQGVFAQNEHFVILPVLGGLWLLLNATSSNKHYAYMLSGLLFGVAFLMKQHGGVFILFAGFYIGYTFLKKKPIIWSRFFSRSVAFSAGAIIPFAALCGFHMLAGDFRNFWFWTFTYAFEYATSLPLETGLNLLKGRMAEMADSAILMWCLGGIGVVALLWDEKIRPQAMFILSFFLFSILSVCPGFYFRSHYFILIIPAVAILIGVGFSSIKRLLSNALPPVVAMVLSVCFFALTIFYCVYKERLFFFSLSPAVACRTICGANPFPESVKIGDYIRTHSSENDRIAVIGSEPQIYFYARRLAATDLVNTYAMMELHPYALKMQMQMISEIETTRPKFLVIVNIATSWLRRAGSETFLIDWVSKYARKYYKRVGVVDIISREKTEYHWDSGAAGYSPRSRSWLGIYERKNL
ncbi:MAG: glycosyltransferase family 39 protein [Deltaproteobacteria bacterium]|nr:glycosyltransferase family 39 protein [Deltaproteobacteria bacterium]